MIWKNQQEVRQSQFMNEANFYSHAPITEALFDIQVELPKKITISDLEQLSTDISDDYPIKHTRKRFEGKFELKDGQGATESIDLGIDGFLNWSADKKQVVQFRLDGFTFSRLKPYASWDEHFPEFIKNWTLYEKKVSPMLVKRIAVRFINTIEIPSGKPALDDYLVNSSQPPIKGSVLDNFFNRIEFSLREFDTKAVITQTLVQQRDLSSIPIIFDLEVIRKISSLPTTKMLEDLFKALREIKNDIFEASLTQKTKDLFK